jgi:hypothetical protein
MDTLRIVLIIAAALVIAWVAVKILTAVLAVIVWIVVGAGAAFVIYFLAKSAWRRDKKTST